MKDEIRTVNLRDVAKMTTITVIATLQAKGFHLSVVAIKACADAVYMDMTLCDSISKSAKQFDEIIAESTKEWN